MNEAPGSIKVLVVEDSRVARELLVHILSADAAIQVVGCAASGEEAIEMLDRCRPDVVTMDIHMPKMDGFETTRRMMETAPRPIVIVSATYNSADMEMTFRAMEAGAVAAVEKPPGLQDPQHRTAADKLLDTVKSMSEVRVVRRWPRGKYAARSEFPPPRKEEAHPPAGEQVKVLAIGASTGGPPVLHSILAALEKPVSVPILIVQHISAGFIQGLADWLAQTTKMPVQIARDGELLAAGTAYLAPDGCQMRVDHAGRLRCSAEPPENGLRPSVSCLFRSVASSYGAQGVGILLTGMGRDGADELKLMRDAGAVTFAQDQASSVVFGMPGEAVKIGAATYVLPPEKIADKLRSLVPPLKPAQSPPA